MIHKPSVSSKRTKSSMNFAFPSKHRIRTQSRPSKPVYFYTALPNDSYISEVDETPSPSSQSSPSSRTTTSKSSPFTHHLTSSISLTLENSGSVARDHLASERTFLAYMRTSLALASAGVGMCAACSLYHGRSFTVALLGLVQLYTVATFAGHVHSGRRLHVYIQPLGAAAIILGLLVLIIGLSHLAFPVPIP